MSYLKNFIYLLIISTCIYAQDPHVYWEFNTEPVSNDEYSDEHFHEFPDYDHAEYCVENTDEGYYICAAITRNNNCTNSSYNDLGIIKINYDGEVFDRDYVCDFDVSSPGQTEDPFGIAYYDGYLYIGFHNLIINPAYNPEYDLYEDGYGEYIGKFTLDADPVWMNRVEGCEGLCGDSNYYYLDYMNVDNDGNLILLGTSRKEFTGPVGQTVSTNVTTISKYNESGALLYVSIHHMGYEHIASNNWDDCYPSTQEYPESFTIDDDNNLYFVGMTYCAGLGGNLPYLGKVDLSNGSVLWVKDISYEMPFTKPNTVSLSSNGNIFIGGKQSSYPAAGLLDSNGNPITYKQYVYCYQDPFQSCAADIRDSSFLPNGDIVVVGMWEFTDAQQFGAQGALVFLNEEDLEINRLTRFDGGNSNAAQDEINRVMLTSDNSLLLAGQLYIDSHGHAVVYKISSMEGCADESSCNYDEFADYDDGSCWQEQDSCTCEDGEGVVDDACGECDGNGYDTCDNDSDGTSNYDQWGYGAYNIELTDIPGDYGGGLYMTFNKSFYDQDDATRNEFYTVERYDDAGWVSLNSISAYNQETYTTEVSTQFDGSETQFRVIATMDEGTFISTSNGSGTSVDNLTILGCMDIDACNYYSQATLDDGTCTYNDYGYECDATLSEGFVELWNVPYSIETTTSLDLVSTGLTGTISSDLGELVNLTYLNLGYNNLTGEIPSEIGNLTNLEQINLYGNELTGSIPEEIGNLTNLIGIDVYDNNLTGEIPAGITNSINMIRIQLDNNQLTGSIPEDIGNLTNMDMLYLHNNQLSGTVPESICSIYSNLNVLTLDNNKLCPVYPSCITASDIGNQDISECVIPGCTDENACNYWSLATIDDGTCFMGYDYCIDLDDDGFGDPEYIYTQCEYTEPNPLYVDNCDDICPDDNGVNVDSDGDGVCDDSDGCPLDADDDSDSDGVCYNDEIFGCSDESACNYDDTVTESDDSCTYAETNYDCDGNCVVEFDCAGECGGSAVDCAPGITSITDVADDQGGRVYISFTSSLFDTDGVFRSEIYSVERSDNNQWVNVLSGSAYNDTDYTYEVTTLNDSTGTSDAVTSFRVIANMDEGVWISDEATGWSVDNIAPSTPGNFTSSYEDETIILNWDDVEDYDFDYYTLLRDGEFVIETTENTYTHTPDTDQIELTYTLIASDIHDNESTSATTEVLQTNYSAGDLNQDNNYNVFDIVILIDVILDNYYGGQTPSTFVIWASDINDDGTIDILDIINLVNQIMDINLN